MLSGFTPPYTPSGCSSLVPAPPWHYAGQVMSLAFQVDREDRAIFSSQWVRHRDGQRGRPFLRMAMDDGRIGAVGPGLFPIQGIFCPHRSRPWRRASVLLSAHLCRSRHVHGPGLVAGLAQESRQRLDDPLLRSRSSRSGASARRDALRRKSVREGSPLGGSDDHTQRRSRRAHWLPCYADVWACWITDADRQA
jgi:hypothetical protein